MRLSPVHDRLAAAGAVFGSKMGWERPNVFAPAAGARLDYSWGKPSWLPWSAAEQRATREAVAVFDQTSFSKYVVAGPDALEALQWVCAADVDVPVGRCVYTPWLNERGTYEADVTVTRDGPDSLLGRLVVRHHCARPRLAAPAGRCRGGRRHRRVRRAGRDGTGLARAAGAALVRRLVRRGLPVRHQPARGRGRRPAAGHPDDLRRRARLGADDPGGARRGGLRRPVRRGRDLGVTNAGYYTIDSLRLEKGFRAFPRELSPDYTPGRGRAGSSPPRSRATSRSSAVPPWRRSATGWPRAARVAGWCPSCSTTRPRCSGAASSLLRDGRPAGQVTSAAWGETVGASVGLAYLRSDGPVTADSLAAGRFEVDVAGRAVRRTAVAEGAPSRIGTSRSRAAVPRR